MRRIPSMASRSPSSSASMVPFVQGSRNTVSNNNNNDTSDSNYQSRSNRAKSADRHAAAGSATAETENRQPPSAAADDRDQQRSPFQLSANVLSLMSLYDNSNRSHTSKLSRRVLLSNMPKANILTTSDAKEVMQKKKSLRDMMSRAVLFALASATKAGGGGNGGGNKTASSSSNAKQSGKGGRGGGKQNTAAKRPRSPKKPEAFSFPDDDAVNWASPTAINPDGSGNGSSDKAAVRAVLLANNMRLRSAIDLSRLATEGGVSPQGVSFARGLQLSMQTELRRESRRAARWQKAAANREDEEEEDATDERQRMAFDSVAAADTSTSSPSSPSPSFAPSSSFASALIESNAYTNAEALNVKRAPYVSELRGAEAQRDRYRARRLEREREEAADAAAAKKNVVDCANDAKNNVGEGTDENTDTSVEDHVTHMSAQRLQSVKEQHANRSNTASHAPQKEDSLRIVKEGDNEDVEARPVGQQQAASSDGGRATTAEEEEEEAYGEKEGGIIPNPLPPSSLRRFPGKDAHLFAPQSLIDEGDGNIVSPPAGAWAGDIYQVSDVGDAFQSARAAAASPFDDVDGSEIPFWEKGYLHTNQVIKAAYTTGKHSIGGKAAAMNNNDKEGNRTVSSPQIGETQQDANTPRTGAVVDAGVALPADSASPSSDRRPSSSPLSPSSSSSSSASVIVNAVRLDYSRKGDRLSLLEAHRPITVPLRRGRGEGEEEEAPSFSKQHSEDSGCSSDPTANSDNHTHPLKDSVDFLNSADGDAESDRNRDFIQNFVSQISAEVAAARPSRSPNTQTSYAKVRDAVNTANFVAAVQRSSDTMNEHANENKKSGGDRDASDVTKEDINDSMVLPRESRPRGADDGDEMTSTTCGVEKKRVAFVREKVLATVSGEEEEEDVVNQTQETAASATTVDTAVGMLGAADNARAHLAAQKFTRDELALLERIQMVSEATTAADEEEARLNNDQKESATAMLPSTIPPSLAERLTPEELKIFSKRLPNISHLVRNPPVVPISSSPRSAADANTTSPTSLESAARIAAAPPTTEKTVSHSLIPPITAETVAGTLAVNFRTTTYASPERVAAAENAFKQSVLGFLGLHKSRYKQRMDRAKLRRFVTKEKQKVWRDAESEDQSAAAGEAWSRPGRTSKAEVFNSTETANEIEYFERLMMTTCGAAGRKVPFDSFPDGGDAATSSGQTMSRFDRIMRQRYLEKDASAARVGFDAGTKEVLVEDPISKQRLPLSSYRARILQNRTTIPTASDFNGAQASEMPLLVTTVLPPLPSMLVKARPVYALRHGRQTLDIAADIGLIRDDRMAFGNGHTQYLAKRWERVRAMEGVLEVDAEGKPTRNNKGRWRKQLLSTQKFNVVSAAEIEKTQREQTNAAPHRVPYVTAMLEGYLPKNELMFGARLKTTLPQGFDIDMDDLTFSHPIRRGGKYMPYVPGGAPLPAVPESDVEIAESEKKSTIEEGGGPADEAYASSSTFSRSEYIAALTVKCPSQIPDHPSNPSLLDVYRALPTIVVDGVHYQRSPAIYAFDDCERARQELSQVRSPYRFTNDLRLRSQLMWMPTGEEDDDTIIKRPSVRECGTPMLISAKPLFNTHDDSNSASSNSRTTAANARKKKASRSAPVGISFPLVRYEITTRAELSKLRGTQHWRRAYDYPSFNQLTDASRVQPSLLAVASALVPYSTRNSGILLKKGKEEEEKKKTVVGGGGDAANPEELAQGVIIASSPPLSSDHADFKKNDKWKQQQREKKQKWKRSTPTIAPYLSQFLNNVQQNAYESVAETRARLAKEEEARRSRESIVTRSTDDPSIDVFSSEGERLNDARQLIVESSISSEKAPLKLRRGGGDDNDQDEQLAGMKHGAAPPSSRREEDDMKIPLASPSVIHANTLLRSGHADGADADDEAAVDEDDSADFTDDSDLAADDSDETEEGVIASSIDTNNSKKTARGGDGEGKGGGEQEDARYTRKTSTATLTADGRVTTRMGKNYQDYNHADPDELRAVFVSRNRNSFLRNDTEIEAVSEFIRCSEHIQAAIDHLPKAVRRTFAHALEGILSFGNVMPNASSPAAVRRNEAFTAVAVVGAAAATMTNVYGLPAGPTTSAWFASCASSQGGAIKALSGGMLSARSYSTRAGDARPFSSSAAAPNFVLPSASHFTAVTGITDWHTDFHNYAINIASKQAQHHEATTGDNAANPTRASSSNQHVTAAVISEACRKAQRFLLRSNIYPLSSRYIHGVPSEDVLAAYDAFRVEEAARAARIEARKEALKAHVEVLKYEDAATRRSYEEAGMGEHDVRANDKLINAPPDCVVPNKRSGALAYPATYYQTNKGSEGFFMLPGVSLATQLKNQSASGSASSSPISALLPPSPGFVYTDADYQHAAEMAEDTAERAEKHAKVIRSIFASLHAQSSNIQRNMSEEAKAALRKAEEARMRVGNLRLGELVADLNSRFIASRSGGSQWRSEDNDTPRAIATNSSTDKNFIASLFGIAPFAESVQMRKNTSAYPRIDASSFVKKQRQQQSSNVEHKGSGSEDASPSEQTSESADLLPLLPGYEKPSSPSSIMNKTRTAKTTPLVTGVDYNLFWPGNTNPTTAPIHFSDSRLLRLDYAEVDAEMAKQELFDDAAITDPVERSAASQLLEEEAGTFASSFVADEQARRNIAIEAATKRWNELCDADEAKSAGKKDGKKKGNKGSNASDRIFQRWREDDPVTKFMEMQSEETKDDLDPDVSPVGNRYRPRVSTEPRSLLDFLARRFDPFENSGGEVTRVLHKARDYLRAHDNITSIEFVDKVLPMTRRAPNMCEREEATFYSLRGTLAAHLVSVKEGGAGGCHFAGGAPSARSTTTVAERGTNTEDEHTTHDYDHASEGLFPSIPADEDPVFADLMKESAAIFPPPRFDPMGVGEEWRAELGGEQREAVCAENTTQVDSVTASHVNTRDCSLFIPVVNPLEGNELYCKTTIVSEETALTATLADATEKLFELAKTKSDASERKKSKQSEKGTTTESLDDDDDAAEDWPSDPYQQFPIGPTTAVAALSADYATHSCFNLAEMREKSGEIASHMRRHVLNQHMPISFTPEVMRDYAYRIAPDLQRIRIGIACLNGVYHYFGPPTIINHPVPTLRTTPARFQSRDMTYMLGVSAIALLQEYNAMRKGVPLDAYLKEYSNGFLTPIPSSIEAARALIPHPFPNNLGMLAFLAHQERCFGGPSNNATSSSAAAASASKTTPPATASTFSTTASSNNALLTAASRSPYRDGPFSQASVRIHDLREKMLREKRAADAREEEVAAEEGEEPRRGEAEENDENCTSAEEAKHVPAEGFGGVGQHPDLGTPKTEADLADMAKEHGITPRYVNDCLAVPLKRHGSQKGIGGRYFHRPAIHGEELEALELKMADAEATRGFEVSFIDMQEVYSENDLTENQEMFDKELEKDYVRKTIPNFKE